MEIKNTKLYSVRQVAQMTGKSVRTIHNYINDDKIDYLRVDNFRLITADDLDKIKKIEAYRKPGTHLDGYVTIRKAAHILGIAPNNLKGYVLKGRLPEHVMHNGVYFIPNETVDIWQQVDEPEPNRVEAFMLDALTVQQAGIKLGYSDGYVRTLVREGHLKVVEGYCRNYVTLSSIDDMLEQAELLDNL